MRPEDNHVDNSDALATPVESLPVHVADELLDAVVEFLPTPPPVAVSISEQETAGPFEYPYPIIDTEPFVDIEVTPPIEFF